MFHGNHSFLHAVFPLAQAFHLILIQTTPLRIENSYFFSHVLLDSLQWSDVLRRGSHIIAHQRISGISIWTDHRNSADFFFLKRQKVLFIFQQRQASPGCFHGQLYMLRTLHFLIGNIRIGRRVILHHAKPDPDLHKTLHCFCDGFFTHKSHLISLRQMQKSISTIQITAIVHRHCSRFFRNPRHMVMQVEIIDCPAIRYHMSFKSEFVPQNVL